MLCNLGTRPIIWFYINQVEFTCAQLPNNYCSNSSKFVRKRIGGFVPQLTFLETNKNSSNPSNFVSVKISGKLLSFTS